jgi:hypothetical protein
MNTNFIHSNQEVSSDDSSNKQYTFTIENGVVKTYFEVENGVSEQESIDDRDTFVIDGKQITHTKQTSNGPEIEVFVDSDDDGFYIRTSQSNQDGNDDGNDDNGDDDSSGNHKVFKFEINNNQVVAVFELKNGVFEPKSLDDNGTKSYTVSGNDVIRTEIKPFGTEITRYSDADGDGQYIRVFEQWQITSNPTGVIPKFTDTITFTPTSNDDNIAVRGGEHCRGGQGADDFIFREADHLRIEDFSSNDGDILIFDTGLGLTSKEHLASFITETHQDGQNFIVNFGPSVSITLIGVLPDQISWDDVSVLS